MEMNECLARNCIRRDKRCDLVCTWWTYEQILLKARKEGKESGEPIPITD